VATWRLDPAATSPRPSSPYPPLRAMVTLAAVEKADQFVIDPDDGAMCAVLGGEGWLVTGDEIDALAARGWIALPGEDQIEVTTKGRWWLDKWRRTPEGRAVMAGKVEA
jgi:hypothetical protein